MKIPKIPKRKISGGIQKSTLTGSSVALARIGLILKDESIETIIPLIGQLLEKIPAMTMGQLLPEILFWGTAIYSIVYDETNQPNKVSQLKKWAENNGFVKDNSK